MKYAGFWRRAFALIIDQFVISFLMIFVGLGAGLALNAAGVDIEGPDNVLSTMMPWIGGVFIFLYFAGLESSEAQGTVGKGLLKVKVVDLEGNRISFRRASARTLGKIISYWIVLVGFLMAAFTKKKQGLHDIMAKCLVIKE